MRHFVVPAFLLTLAVSPSYAQEPEIRRAVPVERAQPAAGETPVPVRRAEPVSAESFDNPAWMERVRPATPVNPTLAPTTTPRPVPTAVPVPTVAPMPTPRSSPPPVPGSLPVPPPPSRAPALPAATPTSATAEADPAASGPEGVLGPEPSESDPGMHRALVAANGFYRRKMYEMAVYEYEKFLIAEPSAGGRDGALFRLGESHRFLGNERAARDAYQRLLLETKAGEFAGSASYRLGEVFYTEGNYRGAFDMFARAETNAASPEVKLSAMFYQANALDKLGRRAQAAQQFAKIVKVEGDNPYRDTAGFYLAEDLARSGKKKEAFAAYEKLATDADKPEMQAESMVKAGALAAELGQEDRAKELFDRALSMPAIGDWSGIAKLGVMRLAYDAGRYREVIAATEKGLADLPPGAVPEALLISANARRQLGQPGDIEKALALYDRILAEYPKSDAASQAQFQRLVCLEATGAPDLAKQLDDFLLVSTNPRERAQATLLKAETLFKAGDYAGAAPLYARVLDSPLPERLRTQAGYKLGWSQLQAGQTAGAVRTFSDFIAKNPKSELLVSALTQRAMAHQQAKAYAEAIADFDRVIADFPKAKEREVALQQKALVLGQQEDYDGMAKAFAQLLEEYPKSKGTAQAEYWIGWRAFEKKDYAAAIPHLKRARELDEKAFGERATLRIVLAHYYGEDRDAVAAEVAKAKMDALPAEVLTWLGLKYYEDGDYRRAEEFLAPVAQRGASPDSLLALARARLAQKKFDAARDPVKQYLAAARDPLSRARGLLASAEISLGTGNYEDANKLVEEAMLLQPEGRTNGEARLLAGEVLLQRGEPDAAARTFMTISVLYDDPEVTPKALARAAAAYKKAGNSAEAEKALAERAQRYPGADSGRTPKPTPAKSAASE